MTKSRTFFKFIAQILLASFLCMSGMSVSAQTNSVSSQSPVVNTSPKGGTIRAGSGYKILRSNFNPDNYFQAEISKKGVLVKGKTIETKNKLAWFIIKNASGKTVAEAFSGIGRDGSYQSTLPQTFKADGKYTLNIYAAPQKYSTYDTVFYGIPMEIKNGDFTFMASLIYASNSQHAKEAALIDSPEYIQSTADTDIKRKTLALIAGINNPKQKVKVIHDWITENIYYDWDAFNSGNIDSSLGSADEVFKSKRSVCQGYAELFLAMVREAGIPCRLIEGNAIWTSEGQTWQNVYKTKVNHVWNEVFLDTRWVILDVTWDSGNKYENGKFIKGKKNYTYFDPTMEFFSLDHLIIAKPVYKPAAPAGLNGTLVGTAVNLTWNPVAGAEYYNVYIRTLYESYDVIVAEDAKIRITGLKRSTKHYFYVTAVNSLGEGNASATVTGTTGQ